MSDEMEVDVPRKRGRPRKVPFKSILSAETILEIKGITPEEDAAKKERLAADAKRKREERARVRAEKEVEGIETKEALWEMNRKLLPESELNALLEKQERAFDQVHWANGVLNGTNLPPADPDHVSVEEGAADLFEFAKTHGVVAMELVLLGPYWQMPLYTEKFQGADPDSIFARLGLVVGFPSHKLNEFEQYLAARKATPTAAPAPPSGNGYTTLSCKCGSPPHAVPQSIADRYRELGLAYQCQRCRDLERKSRMESTIVLRGAFTVYGRPQ